MIKIMWHGLSQYELSLLYRIFSDASTALMNKKCTVNDCETCETQQLCKDLSNSADYVAKLLTRKRS